MEVSVEKQIKIYDYLNARHTVTSKGVDKLSWEEILEIGNIIKNSNYERTYYKTKSRSL